MIQNVIYEAPVALKTQASWFGERAVSVMLEVTEIIRPFVQLHYPGLRHNYQSYFVSQTTETDDGMSALVDRRILSNLIPGCPVFYPVRMEKLPNNLDKGFIKNQPLPMAKNNDLYNSLWDVLGNLKIRLRPIGERFNLTEQRIISRRNLNPDKIAATFGAGAVRAMHYLDDFAEHLDIPAVYKPYLVRQFDNEKSRYVGLVLTNLAKGFPILYPKFKKDFAANRSGGFRSIILPDDLLQQIGALDYTGCALAPRLPNDR